MTVHHSAKAKISVACPDPAQWTEYAAGLLCLCTDSSNNCYLAMLQPPTNKVVFIHELYEKHASF